MRLVSINSTYDVADAVRKRIIRLVEGNVYLQAHGYLHDKQAGGKRKNYT